MVDKKNAPDFSRWEEKPAAPLAYACSEDKDEEKIWNDRGSVEASCPSTDAPAPGEKPPPSR